MDFFGVQSVDIVGRCTTSYLFIGTASVFVMPCFSWNESFVIDLLSFHF